MPIDRNAGLVPWVALGEQIGLNAWPIFLVLTALAVAGAGGIAAWCIHGRAHGGDTARPVRTGFVQRLGLGLVTSSALVIATAAGFSALARLQGDGRTLQLADEALSRNVALHLPAWALSAFGWITHLGEPKLLIALGVGIGGALWWRKRRGLALGWASALGGNALLNPMLKSVFERARPVHPDIAVPAMGFSFPSGHSSGAMVTYGMLAYLAWRLLPPRWHVAAIMVATALVLTTAASRVFLRVHFASDVVAGLCSGGAWLALCIGSIEWARGRAASRG